MSGLEFVGSGNAPSAGSGGGLTPTPVKTANYTAVAGDLVRVDTTGGAVTVTLPAAAAGAAPIGVKLVTQGGSNGVTIAAAGSDVFNKVGGSTTLPLTLLNQGVVLAPIAGVWVVQADDLALTQLDSRYRPTVPVAPAAAGYDVILIAGQSNAVGYTGASSWDYQHSDPYGPDIWQYASGASTYAGIISVASDPLGHPDTGGGPVGVGPGMGFARWWAKTHPGRRVLLVPFAVGGTGLSEALPDTWNPAAGSTSLYSRSVVAANAAIAAAQAIAPSSALVAILWHQGEYDSWANQTQSQYATLIDALIDGYRGALTGATAQTPFILGRMVPEWIGSGGSGTSVQVDKAHADTPRRKAYTWAATGSVGTFDGANPYHYSAAGQRLMGQRMFFALTNALANTGSAVIVPDPPAGPLAAKVGTSVVLTWLPANSNAAITGYEVWRGTASGGETLLATVGNVLTYTDSAVSNGTTYYYKIKAISASGTSAFSSEKSFTYILQTLIAADTFNRANSAITNNASTLGTTDTGSKAWTYRAGFQIYVSSNQAALTGPTYTRVTVDAGVADVDVSAKLAFESPGTPSGIVARYTDESNFVELRVYDSNHYELVKTIGGTETVMAASGDNGRINVPPAINDVIRLVAKGTAYTVYVNGTQVASLTDAGPSTTATHVGLRNKGAGTALFDDFSVYTAP